jgi:hypothetical protein
MLKDDEWNETIAEAPRGEGDRGFSSHGGSMPYLSLPSRCQGQSS